jgi:hypothetical protein
VSPTEIPKKYPVWVRAVRAFRSCKNQFGDAPHHLKIVSPLDRRTPPFTIRLMKETILVVEDEAGIAENITYAL